MHKERGKVNNPNVLKRLLIIDYIYQYLLIGTTPKTQYEDNDIKENEYDYLVDLISKKDELIASINKTLINGWTFERLGYIEKSILLNAHYELLFLKLDKALVINEAVDMVKYYTYEDEYKYIHSALDKVG